ncbi:MAG TPA: VIT1/CCC1 transporter family protein [Steroidobacteraceae bacterium]|nr:VIT1/CCC1 transporter family protein [Steroidobacteraceae bacterium]
MSGSGDGWYHEKESAWLYLQVAAVEPDPAKRALFLKLAATAEDQANKWLAAHPGVAAAFRPAPRARLVAKLAKWLGPRNVRPVLAAMKLRGLSVYTSPKATVGHPMPTSVAQVGERHTGIAGGNLRAAVFGANDGLVSNASLVLGVIGAGASDQTVLMTGAAGLLAGALSMAAGEYVSVRSQRDMYEYQMELEREELAEYPEAEAEELALIYNARGIEMEQARSMSTALLANPEHALDVLAREELGLNPDDLGSPLGAAAFSFLAFASGALLPLLPILLNVTAGHLIAAVAGITLVALFLIGMTLSLFTGRHAVLGGLRMLVIGAGAGLIAYFVGRALGAVVG